MATCSRLQQEADQAQLAELLVRLRMSEDAVMSAAVPVSRFPRRLVDWLDHAETAGLVETATAGRSYRLTSAGRRRAAVIEQAPGEPAGWERRQAALADALGNVLANVTDNAALDAALTALQALPRSEARKVLEDALANAGAAHAEQEAPLDVSDAVSPERARLAVDVVGDREADEGWPTIAADLRQGAPLPDVAAQLRAWRDSEEDDDADRALGVLYEYSEPGWDGQTARRLDIARKLADERAEAWGGDLVAEDPAGAIADLMTDLLHLARRQNLDPDAIAHQARQLFGREES